MLLWSDAKGVYVNVFFRDACVVLVGLYKSEVGLRAHLETIVTVKHDKSISHKIDGVRWYGGTWECGRVVDSYTVSFENGLDYTLSYHSEFTQAHNRLVVEPSSKAENCIKMLGCGLPINELTSLFTHFVRSLSLKFLP